MTTRVSKNLTRSKDFKSARLGTLAGSTTYTSTLATHGIADILDADIMIICETADNGYAIGDRVFLTKYDYDGTSGAANAITQAANGDLIGRTAASPRYPNKSTNGPNTLTLASWGIYLVASGR